MLNIKYAKSAYLSCFYAFMLITEMLYLFVKINIDTTVLVIVIAFRGVSCQQITLVRSDILSQNVDINLFSGQTDSDI